MISGFYHLGTQQASRVLAALGAWSNLKRPAKVGHIQQIINLVSVNGDFLAACMIVKSTIDVRSIEHTSHPSARIKFSLGYSKS